jgi:hypothetical protein
MIGYDDIYDATDSPFVDNYLVNHHLLHPQQVLDYIANQDRTHALLQSSHNDPDDNNHPHVTNIATQTEPSFGLDPSVSSTVNMVTTRSRAQTISHTDTTVPSITIPDELIPSSSSCISAIHPRFVTDPRITFDSGLTELDTAQRLDPDIQHITDFRSSQAKQLYQHGSEPKVPCHPAAAVRNLQVMLFIEDHMSTFSRTHANEISWHVLKSSIRRSYSKYISPSKASCCFRSPVSFYGRRYHQFLQSITTHLISWWLVLFTILLGTETAHYLHDDLHCSETRSLNIGYIFLLALLSLVSRTITLATLEPFVKTIEILRKLETLLIYGIT